MSIRVMGAIVPIKAVRRTRNNLPWRNVTVYGKFKVEVSHNAVFQQRESVLINAFCGIPGDKPMKSLRKRDHRTS